MVFPSRIEIQDSEKKLFRNLERSAMKFEEKKSHLMFVETCYDNDILPNLTRINLFCNIQFKMPLK